MIPSKTDEETALDAIQASYRQRLPGFQFVEVFLDEHINEYRVAYYNRNGTEPDTRHAARAIDMDGDARTALEALNVHHHEQLFED